MRKNVVGPIQDDEALLLFSLIRCMRLRTVVEVGGASGYSARNFCRAVGPLGRVITLDLYPVPQVAANHVVVVGDATLVGRNELQIGHVDLIFFDCHVYDVQMTLLKNLIANRLVDDDTVIALHDTNTHPPQSSARVVSSKKRIEKCRGNHKYSTSDGFVHQETERRMVNDLKRAGYDAFCLHSKHDRHDENMPFRHGLTIMKKFKRLEVRRPFVRHGLSVLKRVRRRIVSRTTGQ